MSIVRNGAVETSLNGLMLKCKCFLNLDNHRRSFGSISADMKNRIHVTYPSIHNWEVWIHDTYPPADFIVGIIAPICQPIV
jgi:hypothetical protein